MPSSDDWADALAVDTSEDVHVTSPTEDIYVFYTEDVDEYIRTDTVIDVMRNR